jgi:hypothetical protein
MNLEAVVGTSKVRIAQGSGIWQHGKADVAARRSRPDADISQREDIFYMFDLRLCTACLLMFAGPVAWAEATPTPLPMPPGAEEVREDSLNSGGSFRRSFVIRPKFPATPALDLYTKTLDSSWINCNWGSGDWEHFGDMTTTPPRTIHQKLHAWVNPKLHRILFFWARYQSVDRRIYDWPDNDRQLNVMIEGFHLDVHQYVDAMKLSCRGLGDKLPMPKTTPVETAK